MPRTRKPSGGRRPSKTCRIRIPELEGRRWAVLRRDRINTAVAGIGQDGLTTDEYHNVPTASLFDEQPVLGALPAPIGPVPAVIAERGTVTIPSEMRRHLRMQPGSPILIEERRGEIVIRPAEIVPRQVEADPTLEVLLAGVTAENLHNEVPAGPPVGRESW